MNVWVIIILSNLGSPSE